MRNLQLLILFFALSLVVMVFVDYLIGPEAEYLNAFSVVQRLLGQSPSAGESVVAHEFGAIGELVAVVMVNMVIGGMLAFMLRLIQRQ